MVHAEYAAGAIQMLHQQAGLFQHLRLGQQLKAAIMHPVVERGLLLHHQRQHPDILRIHGVKRLCRFNGVLVQQLRAAQSSDGRDRQRHAISAHFLTHSHDLFTHVALTHPLQHRIAARLQPHIDHGESLGPQSLQLLIGTDTDG